MRHLNPEGPQWITRPPGWSRRIDTQRVAAQLRTVTNVSPLMLSHKGFA